MFSYTLTLFSPGLDWKAGVDGKRAYKKAKPMHMIW